MQLSEKMCRLALQSHSLVEYKYVRVYNGPSELVLSQDGALKKWCEGRRRKRKTKKATQASNGEMSRLRQGNQELQTPQPLSVPPYLCLSLYLSGTRIHSHTHLLSWYVPYFDLNTSETQDPPGGASLDSQGVYVPHFAQFLVSEECAQLCDHGFPRMFWNIELM